MILTDEEIIALRRGASKRHGRDGLLSLDAISPQPMAVAEPEPVQREPAPEPRPQTVREPAPSNWRIKMDLQAFAAIYKLRLFSDKKALKPSLTPDGTPRPDSEHIPGRKGWITTGKVFLFGHRITHWLVEARRLGMTPQGRGDLELALYFDPTDSEQAAWVIKTVGERKKRQVSEEQRAVASTRMAEGWSSRQNKNVALNAICREISHSSEALEEVTEF
jgi:hypothetical protein